MDAIDPRHVDSFVATTQRIVSEGGAPVGFDARAWIVAWIHAPVPALGGARPVVHIVTGEGQAIVETLILQIESGAYS